VQQKRAAAPHIWEGRMVRFVADVRNGKTFSLAKHYWLFLVVPGIFISALTKSLELSSLSIGDRAYDLASKALQIVALIIFVIGYAGLINCARVRRFRGWSAIAVGVATLSFIAAIAGRVTGNPESQEKELYEAAGTINAQLPKKIDNKVTMVKDAYSDHVFKYYIEMDDP
jgi:hypothetical protein